MIPATPRRTSDVPDGTHGDPICRQCLFDNAVPGNVHLTRVFLFARRHSFRRTAARDAASGVLRFAPHRNLTEDATSEARGVMPPVLLKFSPSWRLGVPERTVVPSDPVSCAGFAAVASIYPHYVAPRLFWRKTYLNERRGLAITQSNALPGTNLPARVR